MKYLILMETAELILVDEVEAFVKMQTSYGTYEVLRVTVVTEELAKQILSLKEIKKP